MITAKVGGVDTPLKFTLNAMDAIENATGKFVGELTFSVKTAEQRQQLLEVLVALISAGGGSATVDTLREEMTPGELLMAIYRVTDAINEGMSMETETPDEDEEVDVVLQELKKNSPTENFPGD